MEGAQLPSPNTRSPETFGIFAWILGPANKTSFETFRETKFKVGVNQYSILTNFSLIYFSPV